MPHSGLPFDVPMAQPQTGLLHQLSRNSTPYQDPLVRVRWDALDMGSFWLPLQALSLYGDPAFDAMPVDRKRALSQYEFLYFIQGALWLESLFMERISRALPRQQANLPKAVYRLHELREEAGHSLMFLELMQRSGLTLPRAQFRRLNLTNLLGRHAPSESTVFWIAVLIGEEVPDRMNRMIRKHRDEISPTVYDIISVHLMDEARHIAHARDTLDGLIGHLPVWQRWGIAPLMKAVFRQFVQAFYFPSPEVYELAGLTPGHQWARAARRNLYRARFVDECVATALRLLRERGLRLDWR